MCTDHIESLTQNRIGVQRYYNKHGFETQSKYRPRFVPAVVDALSFQRLLAAALCLLPPLEWRAAASPDLHTQLFHQLSHSYAKYFGKVVHIAVCPIIV